MSGKPKFSGTGITQEQVFDFDDPAAADIVERGTLEGLCSQIERECFAIMRAHDLPDRHWSYCMDEIGNWTFELPDFSTGRWRCCNDLSSVVRQRGYEPDSAVGFAGMMLSDVVWLRRSAQKNDTEGVALHAFHLGIKWDKRRMKRSWEKFALAGRMSATGSSEGAAKRAEAFKQRHEIIRTDFTERLTRTGDPQRAKNATAKHYGIGRRQLNRILAK